MMRSFLLGCLLLAAHCCVAQGFMKAKGTAIVDTAGRPLILRGMGLGGWMLQEGYMLRLGALGTQQRIYAAVQELVGPERARAWQQAWLDHHTTEADIDSMARWGFNSVRLPMHYNLYTLPVAQEPVAGQHTWLEEGFRRTDSLLAWCRRAGLYLILDLHAAPGGQGNDNNISDRNPELLSLWQSEANLAKTVALWRRLAERYRNENVIGAYDLLNEPNWGFADTADRNGLQEPRNEPLRALLMRITDTIRAIDKDHLIIIEGNGWGNNYNGMFPLWDNNTAISFHKYWNFNRKEDIQRFLDIRTQQNAPIWLGETGENSNTWFTEAVRLVEGQGIGWAWWPLKKLGNNNPLEVVPPKGYLDLLAYWAGHGPKPAPDAAFTALMDLARATRAENNTVHRDVVDALIRQPHDVSATPYRQFRAGAEPLLIPAVDYDLGPSSVAYRDGDSADYWVSTGKRSAGNRGRTYRNDGVDILDDSAAGRYYIDSLEGGEWVQYTLEVEREGLYSFALTARAAQPAQVVISTNGGSPRVAFIQKDSWQAVPLAPLRLQKGTHRIRIYGVKGGADVRELMVKGQPPGKRP